MFHAFKKIRDLFRRAPEEDIYTKISQMAYRAGARYGLNSDGGLDITRGDGARMSINPILGGKFLLKGEIITKEGGWEFGEDMMWLYLTHFLGTKAAP